MEIPFPKSAPAAPVNMIPCLLVRFVHDDGSFTGYIPKGKGVIAFLIENNSIKKDPASDVPMLQPKDML